MPSAAAVPDITTCHTEGEYVLIATDQSSGSGLLSLLPIVAIVVLMYFLLIRPQNKRRREALELQSRIGVGDEIQTTSGLYGTVVEMDDESVTLEASPGVKLRFVRGAVGRVVTSTQSPEVDDSDVDNSDASKTIEQG
jgi:preprotein translocase subunit YajC